MNFTELKNFMDKITAWRIPGAEIEVYLENERVFKYASGYSDIQKKKPIDGSLYYMYSTTKPLTATAVLQLLEKGEILLTDPLKEYMPEFSEMYIKKEVESGKFELIRAKNDIQIKHLLSMTAGFDYNWNTPAIKEVIEKTDAKAPTREIVRALAKSPLQFEPGERWAYSLCLDVLGGFVEVVSGKKYSEYVEENIFEPIGMKNSTFRYTEEVSKRMATQYRFNKELLKPEPAGDKNDHSTAIGSEYDGGGAGIISDVCDYAKFASALANKGVAPNGARILSSGSIELMKTNFLSEKMLSLIGPEQVLGMGYGYGCAVRTMIDRAKSGSVGSIGEFSWGGAAGAYLMADTEKKLSLVYTQHLLNNQERYIHPRLRNIVYSALDK